MNEEEKRKADLPLWLEYPSKAVPLIIAITGIVFTATFGMTTCQNQQTQLKVALIPHLSSTNPTERLLGVQLSEQLDQKFAVDAVQRLATGDPEQQVRDEARAVLEAFSKSRRAAVSESARKGIEQADVSSELRKKGLLSKLHDAQSYIDGGTANGYPQAVKIYGEVLDQLSPKALSALDGNLLARAREEDKKGRMDLAAWKYASLFSDFQ